MNSTSKIIIGAVATALLAGIAHGPLGLGQHFISGLTAEAKTKVGDGISVAFDSAPLQRTAVLTGMGIDPASKAKALAAVEAIPGVHSARWVDASTEAPATAAAVANCQADVDAAIKGKTIQFETGKSVINPASYALVATVAKAVKACAGTKIEVAGHTDATGNPASNQTLSESRAASVVAAMVKDGVPADRLVPKGYGSSKPAIEGATPAANATNRRIAFAVASAA